MKKLFLFIAFAFTVGFSANAQVTKADVSKMLSDIGTSIDKIETLMVYNTLSFYSDGSYVRSYSEFKKTNGDYSNSWELAENGLVMKTKKNGVEWNRYFYPYASMTYIEVGAVTIWICLKD